MLTTYSHLHALLGGILIGLASLIAAGASGKIPGISGLLSRSLNPRSNSNAWRITFLLGLVAGAALAFATLNPAAVFRPVSSLPLVAIAGLLVGFGTRIGGGCTSGHGVCGIGLGSKSGIVATLVFMLAGMLTVFVLHHTGLGPSRP